MGQGSQNRSMDGVCHRHPHGDCMARSSAWVARFAALVPAGGPVLDLACGSGRHTRLFHDRGHPVTAIDRNVSRLADLADTDGIEIIEADLEGGAPWPLDGRRYAGVVVTNYLFRPLFPHLLAALDDGGVLIYETFARGNEAFTRPRNPDHLLAAGELLDAVKDALLVVAYEHGRAEEPRQAMVQRICAVRAGPDAVVALPPLAVPEDG